MAVTGRVARARARVRGRAVALLAEAVGRALEEQRGRPGEDVQQVLTALQGWERRTRRDVFTALDRAAAASSAELVRTQMPHVALFSHPHDTLRHALSCAPGEGIACEFGVASGATLEIVAQALEGREVFGFDSFNGLPEHWRLGFEPGAFAHVPPRVVGAELVVGLFAETLPSFLREHPDPIAFLHLDADLYSSTAQVLELLGPRLQAGSVVLFDEYYNYPGWPEHEFRAWTEYVDRTGLQFEYLGLTMDNEQVSVRVTSVGPPGPSDPHPAGRT